MKKKERKHQFSIIYSMAVTHRKCARIFLAVVSPLVLKHANSKQRTDKAQPQLTGIYEKRQ